MSISPAEYQRELEQLEDVCNKLRKEVESKEQSMQLNKNEVVSIRKAMWENTKHTLSNELEAAIEANQYIDAMKQEENNYRFVKKLMQKYKRLLQSPYFARVDFLEDGTEMPEKLYIGVYSYIDNEAMEVVVHDWRAPISSIFYEYELGDASFATKEGITRGQVLLKRQFKIKDTKMKYMFDSSIKIDDEILQEMLSKNTTAKMHNIVTTIQKEQNRIIRYDKGDLLIVQGAAGSGKTSIALHRIAYLLYKDSSISSGNIMIFSPSQVFSDYISNVLPELGEENVQQMTFYEYAAKLLGRNIDFENPNEKLEFLYGKRSEVDSALKERSIVVKTSRSFIDAFRRYVDRLGERSFEAENMSYKGKVLINVKELEELYFKEKGRLPIAKRLKIVRERALYLLSNAQDEKKDELKKKLANSHLSKRELAMELRQALYEEFGEIKDRIFSLTNINIYNAFSSFFDSEQYFDAGQEAGFGREELELISNYTLQKLDRRKIDYDDALLLLYMKCRVDGVNSKAHIKHVVVDEAQDYSLLQYEILQTMFPESSFTILGDLNQSINPYGHIEAYDGIVGTMNRKEAEILFLSKSYRSTRQIMEFAACMLPVEARVQGIDRSGELPKVIRAASQAAMVVNIGEDIEKLQHEGLGSVAVICKTKDECNSIYNQLKEHIKVNLIVKDDDVLRKGVTVIPSYMCKGLEFDGVVVCGADDAAYSTEVEKRLFYTVCTRALHKLHIYYSGRLSPLVEQMDKKLYERINI